MNYEQVEASADAYLDSVAAMKMVPPTVVIKDPNHKWRSLSGLQKAIRRGDEEVALYLGEMVRQIDYKHLLRRLPIIALEDTGIANPDLMAATLRFCGSSAVRHRYDFGSMMMGLISRLANNESDRTCCDSVCWIVPHYDFNELREAMSEASDAALTRVAVESDVPYEKMLAIWYLAGTKANPNMPHREGTRESLLEAYRMMGITDQDLYVVNRGLVMGAEGMPTVYGVVKQNWDKTAAHEASHSDDEFGPVDYYYECPSYAIDMHTLEGRRAYSYFDKMGGPITAMANNIGLKSGKDRNSFIGTLMFWAETERMKNRLRWPLSQTARDSSRVADLRLWLKPDEVVDAEKVMFGELDRVNYARKKVLGV